MKERLTGAIILVALIVLLVPELLTGPIGKKSAPAASSIVISLAAGRPSHPEPPLRSYTLTLGAAQPGHQPMPAAQAPAQSAEGSPESSREIPTETPAQAPALAGARGQTAAPRASLPQAEGSDLPQQSAGPGSNGLQAAKSPAFTGTRGAHSAASSGGWVVQLGSFASRQNADHLARSLERRGFRMSVSPGRAGTRVLWRVRAGPAHDRAAAQRLAARLRVLGQRGELLPVR